MRLVYDGEGVFRAIGDEPILVKRHEIVHAELTRQRNPAFSAKFQILIKECFLNMPEGFDAEFPTKNHLMDDIKINAGAYSVSYDDQGKRIRKPTSLSFANMDEIAFRSFYFQALDFICRKFGHDDTFAKNMWQKLGIDLQ